MHQYSGTLNNLMAGWNEKIRIEPFYECANSVSECTSRVEEHSDVQTCADREAQQEKLCTKSVQQYEQVHAKDCHFRRCRYDDDQ